MKKFKSLILLAIIPVIIGVSGCSRVSNTTANTAGEANSNSAAARSDSGTNPAPAAANADNTKVSSDRFESIYTDIAAKKCKTTSQNEAEGWIIQMCDGVGGYKLEVYEDDIRQSMNVVPPGGKKSELDFQANVSNAFSEFGEKAEWRVEKKDGKPVPFAMIVRFIASDKKDQTETTSYLVVAKIGAEKSCITDVVRPSSEQNEEARKLADAAPGKPCKSK